MNTAVPPSVYQDVIDKHKLPEGYVRTRAVEGPIMYQCLQLFLKHEAVIMPEPRHCTELKLRAALSTFGNQLGLRGSVKELRQEYVISFSNQRSATFVLFTVTVSCIRSGRMSTTRKVWTHRTND